MDIELIRRMIQIAIAERERQIEALREVEAELIGQPVRPTAPTMIGKVREILSRGPATTDEIVRRLEAASVPVDKRVRHSLRTSLSISRRRGEFERDESGRWSLAGRARSRTDAPVPC
jgi:hypothetical protein